MPDHEIAVQSPVELPEDLVTGRDNYYATTVQTGQASEGAARPRHGGEGQEGRGQSGLPHEHGQARTAHRDAGPGALPPPTGSNTPCCASPRAAPFRRIGWPEAIERLTTTLSDADPRSVLLATGPLRGRIAEVTRGFADAYGARLLAFDPLGNGVLREAMRRLFGQEALPDFDIARARHIVSFGADFLGTWIDPTHFSRGYGEFRQGHGRPRGRLVHIDARYSLTAAAADRWLYVHPGSEGLLAMAMAHAIVAEGLGDRDATAALTGGRGASALDAYRPSRVARRIGLPADVIVELAREFGRSENGPALAIGGGSAGAHRNGLFNLTAVYALNALAGSVNRPGGLVFNPAPRTPPLHGASLRDWKVALDDMRAGRVGVLLARDANVAYGLPRSIDARGALRNVERIVSFSSFLDETAELADLILPGSTPLEEWGTDEPDPGPGYATVAFQQPVVNRFNETLGFGDVLLRTAQQLGLGQLPWASMREAVRASAADLHARRGGSVVQPTFEEFWKRALERGGWWDMGATAGGRRPHPRPPCPAPHRTPRPRTRERTGSIWSPSRASASGRASMPTSPGPSPPPTR